MLDSILAGTSGFFLTTIEALGYPGIFLLMLLGNANIPIPSEIIMTFSGFLAGAGKLHFWLVVLVGALGDVAGSLISYLLALRLDHRMKTSKDYERAENWYRRFGAVSLFVGKLIPVIRAFIAFPAGIFRVGLGKFLFLVAAGALIWSFTLTYIGFVLGGNWDKIEPYFRKFDFIIAIAIIIVGIWYLKHRFSKSSHETMKP